MTDKGGKKAWRGPKILDVGSVDEQTTAGVGNLTDEVNVKDHWKAGTIDTGENETAILPEGE